MLRFSVFLLFFKVELGFSTAGLNSSRTDECSCYHGFLPGLGIPGIGSLFCWSPFDCKDKCSSTMVEPCRFRAMCTSQELGPMNCDCSLCKGPTKQYQAYVDHCEPSPCAKTEGCAWDGWHYNSDGGSWGEPLPPGLFCVCRYPNAIDDMTGKCIECPEERRQFDNAKVKWRCTAPRNGSSTLAVV
eukprot:TRINITY_DN982_c0_g1_i1.p1 TRINITY_DN982_c0_g1~~TRINITY_DN982_c0_g1_i1.p1  ORF type:complete len:186 (-),score=18.85 TRINITY_DN982_c0_g1_i1:125-682(-)